MFKRKNTKPLYGEVNEENTTKWLKVRERVKVKRSKNSKANLRPRKRKCREHNKKTLAITEMRSLEYD